MNKYIRFIVALGGLAVISTAGCDPAEASPGTPEFCWTVPTTNADGTPPEHADGSPLTALAGVSIVLSPVDVPDNPPGTYHPGGGVIPPEPDENGRQCVTYNMQRVKDTTGASPDGLWEASFASVDTSGNTSASVKIQFTVALADTTPPAPPGNPAVD